MRIVRRCSCHGKTVNGYESEYDARFAVCSMGENGIKGEFTTYFCSECGLYHITPAGRNVASHESAICCDSTGKPKKWYETYQDAQRAARIGLEERGVKLDVYKCSVCGKYHLTSRKRRK